MAELPSLKLVLNLFTMTAEDPQGDLRLVVKAATNNREQRVRPETAHKSDGSDFNLAKDKDTFAKEVCAIG